MTVVANDGSVALKKEAFQKLADGKITSVLPRAAAAGVVVTIKGTNMKGNAAALATFKAAGVTLATAVDAVLTKYADDEITFVVPAGKTGKDDIVITSKTGELVDTTDTTLDFQFAIIAKAAPAKGNLDTRITLTGTGLDSGDGVIAGVTLKGVPATLVSGHTSGSDFKTVIITAGQGTKGAGDIVITSNGGRTLNGGTVKFTYEAIGDITKVDPAKGELCLLVVCHCCVARVACRLPHYAQHYRSTHTHTHTPEAHVLPGKQECCPYGRYHLTVFKFAPHSLI